MYRAGSVPLLQGADSIDVFGSSIEGGLEWIHGSFTHWCSVTFEMMASCSCSCSAKRCSCSKTPGFGPISSMQTEHWPEPSRLRKMVVARFSAASSV